MKELLKKNKLSVVIGVIYVLLIIIKKDMAFSALGNSTYYLVEMAQILPVIFMLTVSIDVLIPKEWIVKRLGKKSGIAGAALALAFGSLSAGPIYAAFPIAKTLHKKGASVGNAKQRIVEFVILNDDLEENLLLANRTHALRKLNLTFDASTKYPLPLFINDRFGEYLDLY